MRGERPRQVISSIAEKHDNSRTPSGLVLVAIINHFGNDAIFFSFGFAHSIKADIQDDHLARNKTSESSSGITDEKVKLIARPNPSAGWSAESICVLFAVMRFDWCLGFYPLRIDAGNETISSNWNLSNNFSIHQPWWIRLAAVLCYEPQLTSSSQIWLSFGFKSSITSFLFFRFSRFSREPHAAREVNNFQ